MMTQFAHRLTPRNAGFAVLLGGAMWGLYWIPVRYLAELGLPGNWAGVALYIATLVLFSPIFWNGRQGLIDNWRQLIASGFFTGAAFGLYTISLFYTDVVRSILLFYLTPVWSCLLGLIILKERIGLFRMLGILCGLIGLVAVLGGDGAPWPWPRNFGDWLALVSGICWSLGTLGLYRASGVTVVGQMFGFLFGGLVVAMAAAILMGTQFPAIMLSAAGLPVALFAIVTAIYVLPMIWLTIWPATLLSPARVGLLLMSEVVVGLISAALLANEPFGWREALAAVMIVIAAALELSGPQEIEGH